MIQLTCAVMALLWISDAASNAKSDRGQAAASAVFAAAVIVLGVVAC